jgi:hypothetical protein
MPERQLRQLVHEPYEYSSAPRSEESEWDQLVKFGMRKVSPRGEGEKLKVDESLPDREVPEVDSDRGAIR